MPDAPLEEIAYAPNVVDVFQSPRLCHQLLPETCDVGPDQVINWPTKDATVQLMNMKRYDPDFAFITSTAMNGAVILKNARSLGLRTKFISNIRNFEETLIPLSGGAAEGT